MHNIREVVLIFWLISVNSFFLQLQQKKFRKFFLNILKYLPHNLLDGSLKKIKLSIFNLQSEDSMQLLDSPLDFQ